MSHNVESMFYTREPVWHGLGVRVEEAPNSDEALKLAGLDWLVEQKDIYTLDADFVKMVTDNRIEGYKANVRNTDGAVLGIVSDSYAVCQNKDAFAFTDELLNNDVKYETAGSLAGGKRIWLLARMPQSNILGDTIDPYLVFTTGHDGRHKIRVAITPVRVVCQNTLNIALKGAARAWTTSHTGDLSAKLEDAKETLGFARYYMDEFAKAADKLAIKRIDTNMFERIIEMLIPFPDTGRDLSPKLIESIETRREDLRNTYITQDVQNFVGTAWGVLQGVSDFATHKNVKDTPGAKDSLFAKTIDGHPMIDKAFDIVQNI